MSLFGIFSSNKNKGRYDQQQQREDDNNTSNYNDSPGCSDSTADGCSSNPDTYTQQISSYSRCNRYSSGYEDRHLSENHHHDPHRQDGYLPLGNDHCSFFGNSDSYDNESGYYDLQHHHKHCNAIYSNLYDGNCYSQRGGDVYNYYENQQCNW